MRFAPYWRRVRRVLVRAADTIETFAGLPLRPSRHGGRALKVTAVAVAGLMALLVATALGVLGSPTKFEAGDGNMTVEESGNIDWNCMSTLKTTVKVSKNGSTCGSFNAKNYVSAADPNAYTTKDISWKSGQKQDTSCPELNEGKDPGKDTFTNIASYNETALASNKVGDTYLFGATIRFTANGNASENVELNQKAGTSECSILRTAGDKLIAINYLNGGTKVEFSVLTWITAASGEGSEAGENKGTCFVSNDSPPCWGATEKKLSESTAEGKANQSEIVGEDNGINGKALVTGQFAEFGIDLTAAGIIPAGSCQSFPQAVWESRSSGSSFVSNPEDIEIEHHEIANCGSVEVIKQTKPRGVDQVFKFTSTLPANAKAGGVACTSGGSSGIAENGSFCLNDKGNTGKTASENSAENTVLDSAVPAGEYTITEGAEPTGFEFGSLTCKGGTTEVNGAEAKVKLQPEDKVVCVYVDNEQFGALKVTKVSVKPGHPVLKGAEFSITDPSKTTKTYTTDENGVICVDKLSALGTYTVKETKAPAGYALNTEEKTIEVTGTNAECAATTYTGQTLQFEDTPLTKITATAESEAKGGTSSTVTCTNSEKTNIGNSPKEGETAEVSAKGLKPGTYTCTVVVDP